MSIDSVLQILKILSAVITLNIARYLSAHWQHDPKLLRFRVTNVAIRPSGER